MNQLQHRQSGRPPVSTESKRPESGYIYRGIVIAHQDVGDPYDEAVVRDEHGYGYGCIKLRPFKKLLNRM